MYQYQDMPSASPITTTSESSGSSLSTGFLTPYSATSIPGSWQQNTIPPSSLSPSVPQAHATSNPPYPHPMSPLPPSQSHFPFPSVGSLSPASLPTQETWQRVHEGDVMPIDISDGYFSSVDEMNPHFYQSNNGAFEGSDASHSVKYVTVLLRRPQFS
jgi:hypothetical protein